MKKINILLLVLCMFVPLTFSACKNSNKKTLSTPSILEIKGGTIVFNPVDDADYYTLSINENEVKVNVDYSQHIEIIDEKINYDASKIFVVGNSYSVKICANSKDYYDSDFSEVYSYKHSGNIKKPTSSKVNSTTLTWDAVENASYYKVKIITPNDNVIYDKLGNILSEDDAETIAKADLTEYLFNTNQFDFSSLLKLAGNYKFYVCSVLSDGTNYVESGYTSKATYTHTVSLKTPINGKVYKVFNPSISANELHLLTVIDENANAISITCDNIEKSVEINNAEQSIEMLNDNLFDINLNQYFQMYINAGKLNFDEIKQFSFSTQSKYIANSVENEFYLNSEMSNNIIFENTAILKSPELSLDYNSTNNCYVATWNTQSLVGEYRVLVATSTQIEEYKLDADIHSMLITDDFIGVAIQAIGVGNHLSSPLSNFIYNPELANSLAFSNSSTSLSDSTLSWSNVYANYYIVSANNKFYVSTSNNFTIPSNNIEDNELNVRIYPIKSDCRVENISNKKLSYSKKLQTPTIENNQGFNGSKLYEFSFTGVENAIGYYIHIKTKNANNFHKLNTLYTNTAIDLSKYIISAGDYTEYEVKVQAVADKYSLYSNSELSQAVAVTHMKVLDTPEFYKHNDTVTPIHKQIIDGETRYILKFNGVADAGSYEILVNYNKLIELSRSADDLGLYEVDITNYLLTANNYEIKVRALASETSNNVKNSEYNVTNFSLIKQLPIVENVMVAEVEGSHILTFNPVDNAESYTIRIVKENDSSYVKYLEDVRLSSLDVSSHITEKGVYYFYVTAIAKKENGFYADSQESISFGTVDKLNSLSAPKDITHASQSKDSYLLSWTGNENADYYQVKISSPNGLTYEFRVYGETSTNINEYMTVQGTYDISIYSKVNAVGDNAKEYSSTSAPCKTQIAYTYQTEDDFSRYAVSMYGENYNFVIDDVNELKNILWYYYLYDIDTANNLRIMIKPQSGKTLTETIKAFAEEASVNKLYLFSNPSDESFKESTPGYFVCETNQDGQEVYNFESTVTWNDLVSNEATINNKKLFSYLCQKLLGVYPENNVLQYFKIDLDADNNIFTLAYKNSLNTEKVKYTDGNIFINENYGNNYKYIDLYSRKSANGVFKIDSREEELVSTTEQLIQAVQHNKKPRFIGNSTTAEQVYNNAKVVLSAIVANNMSDLEKVTAIFDWLEYSFDISYYSIRGVNYISGSLENSDPETYGKYEHYYLEGIFKDITLLDNGNLKIGSNLATSESYSKAFALLCAIEGIEATVVNGSYSYYDTNLQANKTIDHTWNKVYLKTTSDQETPAWYAVDLTFSDNRIFFNGLEKGYGISSHTHFLVKDSFIEANSSLGLTYTDELYLISSEYQKSRKCDTDYNYYQNSSFGLTLNQIDSTIYNFKIDGYICSNCGYSHAEEPMPESCPNCSSENTFKPATNDFVYSKEYYNDNNAQKDYYQKYKNTAGYGEWKAFILNSLIYATYCADNNTVIKNADGNNVKPATFEFKYKWTDSSENFDENILGTVLSEANALYYLNIGRRGDALGDLSVYTIKDTSAQTTTVVYIVEKRV